jgi:transcriptional regulator with XRE-family HTH domain
MHAYRRLIQAEMDARGWSVSELARRAGMHRQTLNKIVNDKRSHIGQMPDDATIERIAGALGIPAHRLSQAAAQSLIGDNAIEGDPLDTYSTEYLLDYIKRRVSSGLPIAARTEDYPKPE